MTWKSRHFRKLLRGYRVIPRQSIKPYWWFCSGRESMMRQAAAVLEGGAPMTVQRKHMERATGIVLGATAFLILAACSSSEPKPMAQPTPDQVRGHADQNFDKLKQEERERGAQPASPR